MHHVNAFVRNFGIPTHLFYKQICENDIIKTQDKIKLEIEVQKVVQTESIWTSVWTTCPKRSPKSGPNGVQMDSGLDHNPNLKLTKLSSSLNLLILF